MRDLPSPVEFPPLLYPERSRAHCRILPCCIDTEDKHVPTPSQRANASGSLVRRTRRAGASSAPYAPDRATPRSPREPLCANRGRKLTTLSDVSAQHRAKENGLSETVPPSLAMAFKLFDGPELASSVRTSELPPATPPRSWSVRRRAVVEGSVSETVVARTNPAPRAGRNTPLCAWLWRPKASMSPAQYPPTEKRLQCHCCDFNAKLA